MTLGALTISGAFVLDVSTPSGFTFSTPYSLAVVVAAVSRRRRAVVGTGLAAIVLLLAALAADSASTMGSGTSVALLSAMSAGLSVAVATALMLVVLGYVARAEASIARYRELLEIASEMGRVAGWSVDVATEQVEWSGEMDRVLGVPAAERLTVDDALGFVVEEHRGRMKLELAACAEDGVPFDEEIAIDRAGEQTVWARVTGRAVRDAAGQIVAVQGAIQDVTERQELLARESAARHRADATSRLYRSLFESAPGKFLVLTPEELRVVAVSDAYLQATMTRREEIEGRPLFEVFPDDPEDRTADGVRRLRASLERVEATGSIDVMAVQRYPVRRSAEQGGGFEERFWSPVNSPVFGPDGELAYIIHRVEDVTTYVRETRSAEGADAETIELGPRAQLEADIVERSRELREARDRIAESQALLRMSSRLARIGAWSVDIPSGTQTWSDEVSEIHGLEPGTAPSVEEGIGFYAPEYRERIQALFERCSRDGTPYDDELQIVTADGDRVWVRAIGEAVRDEQGAIVRVQGAFQDIQERKEAEAREKALAERISRTLERMSDGFFVLDREWRFVYLNRQAERVLRSRREDLVGQVIWRALRVPSGTEMEVALRAVMEHEESAHFEMHFPRLEAWLELSAHAGPEGLAVYFSDVTKRHRSEAALRESEQRFRLLSRATSDAIRDWSVDAGQVWWSDGFRALFGLDAEGGEPTVDSWRERIHPDDRDRVQSNLDEILRGSSHEWESEYRFRRSDGTYAVVVERGFVIRNDEGEPIRMIGGMTDVTEKRALEVQLRQSQRLEAIGQLTGGVAHDFNNLLTVILGNSELLLEKLSQDDPRRRLADLSMDAARRGAELTQRLLAFARRQILEPQLVDVHALVRGMAGLLRRTLGEQIEIEIFGAPAWRVSIDPSQLEAALLNLALNARDAMPRGGRLTIEKANVTLGREYARTHPEVVPGEHVMIAVSDTGTGIASEHLSRVFDPFFTTKAPGEGTGLGLSMIYGFVKQSGGHVKIYSEPGEGTTVRMYFPRARGRVAQRRPEADLPELIGGSESILLVEDNELVRHHVREQLLGLGYRVVVASTGAEALDRLRDQEDIDLLFTDVVLPGGMNGPALADAARSLRPGIRVLYTSGYAENAVVHHGRLDAGVQLLSKPYRRAELARALRVALDR